MSKLYAALIFGLLISFGCNGTGDVRDTDTQEVDTHEVDTHEVDNQDTDTDDLDVPDADTEGPDGEDADIQEPPPTVLKVMTFNIRTLLETRTKTVG